MKTIVITRDTFVRGEHIAAGSELEIGSDIDRNDAGTLVRLRKAEWSKPAKHDPLAHGVAEEIKDDQQPVQDEKTSPPRPRAKKK